MRRHYVGKEKNSLLWSFLWRDLQQSALSGYLKANIQPAGFSAIYSNSEQHFLSQKKNFTRLRKFHLLEKAGNQPKVGENFVNNEFCSPLFLYTLMFINPHPPPLLAPILHFKDA